MPFLRVRKRPAAETEKRKFTSALIIMTSTSSPRKAREANFHFFVPKNVKLEKKREGGPNQFAYFSWFPPLIFFT